jgi:predicted GNAT superfamily acetyltransferase
MTASSQSIVIRDLRTIDELNQLRAVEKEVWGMAGEDAMPLTIAIALRAAGNIFVGAFEEPRDGLKQGQREEGCGHARSEREKSNTEGLDKEGSDKERSEKEKQEKEKLVGFAFGFLGREHGETTIHSHMLAVLDAYRHLDLGARLKHAQRERALAMGVHEMTWTFDPLQSRNAHFNFAKLGVVSETYKVDFYGPETSSKLHRNGTDRLWVRWLLSSRRVRDRIAGKSAARNPAPHASGGISSRTEMLDALRLLAPLIRFDGKGKPVRAELGEALARERVSIEIPGDILAVEAADVGLAREWREATRWAFRESLKVGFFVSEFCRSVRGQQGPGAYLLQKGNIGEMADV